MGAAGRRCLVQQRFNPKDDGESERFTRTAPAAPTKRTSDDKPKYNYKQNADRNGHRDRYLEVLSVPRLEKCQFSLFRSEGGGLTDGLPLWYRAGQQIGSSPQRRFRHILCVTYIVFKKMAFTGLHFKMSVPQGDPSTSIVCSCTHWLLCVGS